MKPHDQALLDKLNAPLPRDAIRTRKQAGTNLAYVEGWWVFQQLNELFGYDGWDTEIINLEQAELTSYTKNGRDMYRCSYVCHAKLLVYFASIVTDDTDIVSKQDVGTGIGFSASAGDAIEGAAKEAVTDAYKRCARQLGNQFGLPLYDKDRENVETKEEAQERRASPKPTPPVDNSGQNRTAGANFNKFDFLKAIKPLKSKVGDYMYYRILNQHGLMKANELTGSGKNHADTADKIIAQLSELPALISEEGYNIEIGRLVQEYPYVESFVKGKIPKADDERQRMLKQIDEIIAERTKAA